MSRKIVWSVFLAGLILALLSLSATAFGMPPAAPFATELKAPNAALGSAFTYQGQLKINGVSANATCTITFKLFDAPGTGAPPTGGAQVGTTLNQVVMIVNGLFTTQLDFGAVFQGDERWLEMTPDCGAGAVTLSPRQPVTAAPYALFSAAPWVTSGGNLFYTGGTVGIGTANPFPQGTFNAPPLQVVANSLKTTIANTRALAITTNDAVAPFALDIRLNGGAALADRSAYMQTTDFNFVDGGNILLQPSAGRVGVGTASPSNKFSVTGSADFSGNVGIGTTAPVDAKLVIQSPLGVNAFSITDGTVKLFSRLNPTNGEFGTMSNHDLIFTTGGFTSTQIDAAAGNMFPTGDGVSSLGKATKRWTAVFAQNGTIQTSDGRWKTAVTDLSYGLSQIMQLRPITFQWKNDSNGQTHLGLIAQDVENVIPEVVIHSPDPAAPLGMNYSGLEPVMIKAIQEQQATIARNEAEIKALKSDNEALNARLTALEQAVNSGNPASRPASNALEIPWFLVGGLAVLGLVFGKQRRGG